MATLPLLTVSIQAKTRTNLALHHLFAAARSAAQIRKVELCNKGQPFGAFFEEILQNSLVVATMAVASLESYANELYFEGNAVSPALNPAAAQEFLELVDRESVLRKFSLVLAIRAEKRLNFGEPQTQNVEALIKLRNAVIHFRSEWFGEQNAHEKLSKRLHRRFDASPFLPEESLFPNAWASSSFAYWALNSTVRFLRHFYAQAGLPDPLQQFIPRLEALAENAL